MLGLYGYSWLLDGMFFFVVFLDQTQVIEKEVSILTFKPPVFSNHHITLTFWLVHSMEVKTGPCVYTYEHTYISGQIIIFHQPGFPFSVAPIWACEPEVGRSRAIQDETEICVALLTTPKSQRTAPSLTGNICWAANKRKTVWSNSMWICIRTHPPQASLPPRSQTGWPSVVEGNKTK